ncbi:DUF4097 family beta strand repeat-containing protein [Flagellimonas allohymeniacidonis]|nr:DUF4097 family beta strand repeat-containing protein [Allomuricauda hymeniacidonis]
MKNLKLIMAILFMGIATGISGQEKSIDLFTIPLSSPGNEGLLEVEQVRGSITVNAYEGKEVIVKVSVDEDEVKTTKTKAGLKRIGGSGLNISAEEKNNIVQIENEAWNKKTDFDIKVPANFSLKLSTVNEGDIYVKGVTGSLEISNVNGHITLDNVSGSVTTNTTNGEVKVSFDRIANQDNMAFSSFNGDVEVTFPSSLKANIKAKSEMGDVYTDFNMVVSDNKPQVDTSKSSGKYKVKIEQWVRGTINGGGPEMLFKTFNGDILIKSR